MSLGTMVKCYLLSALALQMEEQKKTSTVCTHSTCYLMVR